MLDIFNKLAPFFEDSFAEFGVREYAKQINVSPPTASTILSRYAKSGLLKSREERKYHLYSPNRGELWQKTLQYYWYLKIEESGLLEYLTECFFLEKVILFGSIQKGEHTITSDIDLAIFGEKTKEPSLAKFEKLFKRPIQIIEASQIKSHRTPLMKNIKKGYVLRG